VKNHGYGEGNWNNIIGDELLLLYDNQKNQWGLACKAEHQVDREESQNIKSPVEEGSLLSIHSVISEDTNSTIYYLLYVLYLLSITSAILLFMPN
jgi:hypothetical protein